jgi:hypothetical protein
LVLGSELGSKKTTTLRTEEKELKECSLKRAGCPGRVLLNSVDFTLRDKGFIKTGRRRRYAEKRSKFTRGS